MIITLYPFASPHKLFAGFILHVLSPIFNLHGDFRRSSRWFQESWATWALQHSSRRCVDTPFGTKVGVAAWIFVGFFVEDQLLGHRNMKLGPVL